MALENLKVSFYIEDENYMFQVAGLDEDKRKKQTLRFTFLNPVAGKVIVLPTDVQNRNYCNERGEFTFTAVARGMLSLREYMAYVPMAAFSRMSAGNLVTLRVERLEQDDAVSGQSVLPMMVNSVGKLENYSERSYVQALTRGGSNQDRMAFARRFLSSPDRALLPDVSTMLAQAAQDSSDGEAEFLLFQIYNHPDISDKQAAGQYLRAAAAKRHAEAARLMSSVQPQQSPSAPMKSRSLQDRVIDAQNGDVSAQFSLYEHFIKAGQDHDEDKALEWLKKAAGNGHEQAILALEDYYEHTYLIEFDIGQLLDLLERAAAAGSPQAYYKLFTAYYKGEYLRYPVRREKRKALDYLKKASEGNHIPACYEMWQIFEDGNDLLVDEQEAVALLKKASDNGNPDAMNDLGELYVTGRIVTKNGADGIALICKAAELGCHQAQMRVFRMHLEGRYYDNLFETNVKKAYRLLTDFAKKGNPIAQMELWRSFTDRNPVMLTRFEAIDYLKQAAEQAYYPAMFEMACVYLNGRYKDVDTEAGMALLDKGAKSGGGEAQLALFYLFYHGKYLALERPVNRERAYKWLLLSANSSPEAMHVMWRLYEESNEMDIELSDALDMLSASARKGCCDSMYDMAELLAQGKHVPFDAEKAVAFLGRAAELGHAKSMFRLYEIHTQGAYHACSIEGDGKTAARMLLLSAQLGFEPACRKVCELFEQGNAIGVDATFVRECRSLIGQKAEGAEELPSKREKSQRAGRKGEPPQEELESTEG